MKRTTADTIERIVIPALLGFALLGASVWGATRSAQAETYRQTTQAVYTRAFTELTGSFEEMTVTLGKLLSVSTPSQTVLLLDDVWRLSGASVSLMSQIPQSHLDTVEMNRLVVQLGDYAHALTKKAVRGVAVTAEDREQLQALYETCTRITAALQARLADGDIPLAVITNDAYYSTGAGGQAGSSGSGGAGPAGTTANTASSGGMALGAASSGNGGAVSPGSTTDGSAAEGGGYAKEEGLTEFPTLIYDGPFAESTEKAEPRGLSGQPVNEAQAKAAAERAAGVPVESSGYSDGRIKSYDFTGMDENGAAIDVSVAARSGQIVWLMGSSSSDLSGVPPESETQRYKDTAAQYLSGMGYKDMRATYAQYYGGCALINLAAMQDGAILYNDLIKVWVDRETLRVVGVDARNYLFSHTRRTLETPSISMAQAEALLADGLTVQDRALALIPVTAQSERLCYEFKCTRGEETYILYLNVEDGSEEQIFRVIDDENGQLVL